MGKLKFAILFLLVVCTFHYMKAQPHLVLIEEKYNQLDSLWYLNNLKDAVIRSSIHAYGEPVLEEINREYNIIRNGIKNQNIKFVLNVDIDTTKLDSDNYLLVENTEYSFNIFCHDHKLNPTYYVFFVDDQLDIFGSVYPTFSKKYAKKVKFAIKRVLKKEPKYILECAHLPNTILYVKDDKIFVYRVLQSEEYELNDYVTKFKNIEGFYH